MIQQMRSASIWFFSIILMSTILTGCPEKKVNPCDTQKCKTGFICIQTADGAAACLPPDDPCGKNNPCKATQTCSITNDGTALCTDQNKCLSATGVYKCTAQQKCDPTVGTCVDKTNKCENVLCNGTDRCSPTTGLCTPFVNPCDVVCCDSDEWCDPDVGSCQPDPCNGTAIRCACGPAQVCDSKTAKCKQVETLPCGLCKDNEYCDTGKGTCIATVRGLSNAKEVGSECTTDASCSSSGANAFCIQDKGLFGPLPGGSCSAFCDSGTCPGDSVCIDVGVNICMDACLDKTDCRPGFSCTSISSDNPRKVCFPEGKKSECTGAGCSPFGGACKADSDCFKDGACLRNWPDGMCIKKNCSAQTVAGLPTCNGDTNCLCLGIGDCDNTTYGLVKCDPRGNDCRAGYYCNQVNATTGYCSPRQCESTDDCNSAAFPGCKALCNTARGECQAACTSDASCANSGEKCDTTTGGCYRACTRVQDDCGPDAVCSVTEKRCIRRCYSDSTCFNNTYCDVDAGLCAPKCSGPNAIACKEGDTCDPFGHCQPQCTSNAGCGRNQYCDTDAGKCILKCSDTFNCKFGERCSVGDGRCVPDWSQIRVGTACSADGECGIVNAQCIKADNGGATTGYCTNVGSCTGVESSCPTGSTCQNGKCTVSCTQLGSAGGCRPGFNCTQKNTDSPLYCDPYVD